MNNISKPWSQIHPARVHYQGINKPISRPRRSRRPRDPGSPKRTQASTYQRLQVLLL